MPPERNEKLPYERLREALLALDAYLEAHRHPRQRILVCGGMALNALGLRSRATVDIDVVALVSGDGALVSPAPLPDPLLNGTEYVARMLKINPGWLNNGPSNDHGGLFQMGLPVGIEARMVRGEAGAGLDVYYISRFDQIHFKLYAAVDQRMSRHTNDLLALEPKEEELLAAAMWTRTLDVSEGYLICLQQFLREIGRGSVAERVS